MNFPIFQNVSLLLRTFRQVATMVVLLMLAGCAATSTFIAYPHKIQPLITSLSDRTPIDLSQCLLNECKSNDLILYTMERGRYAQIIGNSAASTSDFSASMAKIAENAAKALISAFGIGANVAATLVNDNAIPYEGEGYERVLLHHYQALNYLNKKDIEGAGVEVRRANAEQEDSLKRFEKEVVNAQREATQKKVGGSASRVVSQYAQMDEVAGKVKNSFQNAYTFYLSGFIYELLKQQTLCRPGYHHPPVSPTRSLHPDNRRTSGPSPHLPTLACRSTDLK